MNRPFLARTSAPVLDARVRWLPIFLVQVYLWFTVLLFAFGPWPWPVKSPVRLYGFLTCAHLALFLGYVIAMRTSSMGYSGIISIRRLTAICIVAGLCWTVPSFYLRGLTASNLGYSPFEMLQIGITDPGKIYNEMQHEHIAYGPARSMLQFANYIVSPIIWMAAPLGFYFWGRLSIRLKISVVAIVLLNLLSWMSIGTNKGLADTVIIAIPVILASRHYIITRASLKVKVVFLGIVLVLAAGFATYFSVGQSGRAGAANNTVQDRAAGIVATLDGPLVQKLPPEVAFGCLAISSYLTQGYYALGLALSEDFTWSYGIGNSYFFTGLSRSFLGPTTVSDATYPAKLEAHGWDRFGRWHSAYTWWASDLTFPGVVLAMVALGWLLGSVWLDSLVGKNPFAIALLSLVAMMCAYIPGNNQVLAFPSTALPFIAMLILWLWTRRPFRAHRIPRPGEGEGRISAAGTR